MVVRAMQSEWDLHCNAARRGRVQLQGMLVAELCEITVGYAQMMARQVVNVGVNSMLVGAWRDPVVELRGVARMCGVHIAPLGDWMPPEGVVARAQGGDASPRIVLTGGPSSAEVQRHAAAQAFGMHLLGMLEGVPQRDVEVPPCEVLRAFVDELLMPEDMVRLMVCSVGAGGMSALAAKFGVSVAVMERRVLDLRLSWKDCFIAS